MLKAQGGSESILHEAEEGELWETIQIVLAPAAVDQYLKIPGSKAKRFPLLTSIPVRKGRVKARAQAPKVREKGKGAVEARVMKVAPRPLIQPVERLGSSHEVPLRGAEVSQLVTPHVVLDLRALNPRTIRITGVTITLPNGGNEPHGTVAVATGVEIFPIPVGAYAEVKVFLTFAGNDGDFRRASYGTALF